MKLTDKEKEKIKNLSPQQVEIQLRLNEAQKNSGLSIPKIAAHFGVNKTPCYRWFNIKIPFERLLEISKLLKVDYLWLIAEENKRSSPHLSMVQEIPANYDMDDDSNDYVVAVSMSFAAGSGDYEPEFVELGEKHAYKKSFLKRNNLNAKNLLVAFVRGESMGETAPDGSKILIDMSKKKIIDMKIYAIRVGDEMKVKKLNRLFNGDIEIISDNEDFPVETLKGVDKESLYIVGQIIEVTTLLI